MSRCVSFWHKFEQEGNFCGMDPTEISRVKAYLEFVGKLNVRGFDKDFIYEKFTAGAARPLIALKDDETRTEALNYVGNCLDRKEKITEGDLKSHIRSLLQKAGKSCSMNARSEKLTNVKIPAQPVPQIEKEPQSEKPIQSLADRVRADEMRASEANQQHVNPGAICTVNPIVVDDSKRQSAFRTGSQVRAGIAGEMYPQQQEPADPPAWTPEVCKSGKCPNGDSYYSPKRGECALCGDPIDKITLCPLLERRKQQVPARAMSDPQTITIRCNDKRWAVLKQVQREGQADSFEDAVLWLIDEAGDRMERE